MDSITLPALNLPALLRDEGLKPDKRLGQSFMVDPAILARVVQVAEVTREENVLEIGAGVGSLTRLLCLVARRVVAVEVDGRLIPLLEQVLQPYSNVKIIHGDILALEPTHLMQREGYLVVANIPYYITSAILRHLLEARPAPRRMVLTVQKEVAERICAEPGEMSLLALSVQVYGRARIVARVPAGCFYPSPKVDSAVIRVDIYPEPLIQPQRLNLFFELIQSGFSQKRKTLRNAMSGGLGWPKERVERLLDRAGIDSTRRAETLSIAEWGRVVEVWHAELEA